MVNQDDSKLNNIFSALADPTRRAILARLTEGEARVTELAEPFAMSLPAITKHLKVLEAAGLLKRHVVGRVHHISLNAGALQSATEWLETYRAFWQKSLDALALLVEDDEDSKK